MSYDTLPALDSLSSKDLTSHPEFGHGTNGSDVAQAFAEHIKDKNGKYKSFQDKTYTEIV